jgi:hypothetical protein
MLTLLLGIYVAAYYLVATPVAVPATPNGMNMDTITLRYPRIGGVNREPFFRPLHRFDRKLRPRIWDYDYAEERTVGSNATFNRERAAQRSRKDAPGV